MTSTSSGKNNKAVKAKSQSSGKRSYQKSILEWRKEIHQGIHEQVESNPDLAFTKHRYHSIKEFSSHC